ASHRDGDAAEARVPGNAARARGRGRRAADRPLHAALVNRRQFVESLIAAAALPIDGGRGFLPAPGGAQAPAAPVAAGTAARPSAPILWYGRAATQWVEALPVGNGRLGAVAFGEVGVERLQINADTLWSGG